MKSLTTRAIQEKTSLALALVTLIVGLILLYIAIPHAWAGYINIPVEKNISLVRSKHRLAAAKIPALIEHAQQSSSIINTAGYQQQLGELYYLQGLLSKTTAEDKNVLLNSSVAYLKASLIAAPANSLAWFELASIQRDNNAPNEDVKNAFLMSILTGPHEANLVIPRLQQLLALNTELSSEDQDQIQHQIITGWSQSPKSFARFLAKDKNSLQNIKPLLQGQHESELNAMQRAAEKLR